MRITRFAVAAVLCLAAATGWAQDSVVYHIDNTAAQGLKGLRNVRNHLDVDPTAKVTVVTHADGVDMLMEGEKAANGTEYAPLVSALKSRGVAFEVCEITLKNRGPEEGAVHPGGHVHAVGGRAHRQAAETGQCLHQTLSVERALNDERPAHEAAARSRRRRYRNCRQRCGLGGGHAGEGRQGGRSSGSSRASRRWVRPPTATSSPTPASSSPATAWSSSMRWARRHWPQK